jgi:hypothetical protein
MRLIVKRCLPFAGGIVGAGGELDWPNPIRPGDTLQVGALPKTSLDRLDVVRARSARAVPSNRRRTIETAGF